MRAFHRLRALVRNVVRRSAVELDLKDELESYVDLVADEARSAGSDAEVAARRGRLRLGGASAVAESIRANRAGASFERFWQDIRYAARGLWRTPSYSVAAIVTLALCIGLPTAVFSVAFGILLRPLPVGNPDRLMALFRTEQQTGAARGHVSGPRFEEWKRRNQVFAGMAAATRDSLYLISPSASFRVEGEFVSFDFFQLLEVSAQRGRVFSPADAGVSSSSVPCVIAEGLWRRGFGSDPGIVGRSFVADDVSFTVVGVVPDAFSRWRQPAELWAPYVLTPAIVSPEVLGGDGYRMFRVFGRLRAGVGPDAAAAAMTALDPQVYTRMDGNSEGGLGVAAVPLRDATRDPTVRRSLLFLSMIAALVMCLGAANVASATLTRNIGRAREFATRLALGGTTRRLIGQLIVEAGVLVMASGAVGVLVAYVVVPMLVALAPPDAMRAAVIKIDLPALVFVVSIAVVLMLAIATITGLRVRAQSVTVGLRIQSHSTLRRGAAAHPLLVMVQATVAVPVVTAAVLLAMSLMHLGAIDLGFNPRGLQVMQVHHPDSLFPTAEALTQFQRRLTERAGSMPALGRFAVSTGMPLNYFGDRGPALAGVSITIEGGRRYLNGDPEDGLLAPGRQYVTPAYFNVLGLPILAGRDFTRADNAQAPRVAVINNTMAKLHWPGVSPVGKRVNFERVRAGRPLDEPWTEIVGVVADARHHRVDAPTRPEIYVPLAQAPSSGFAFVHVRGRGNEATTASALRELLRSTDPRVPVGEVKTVPAIINELTATPRYSAALLAVFSAIALVLAAVGIFGLGAFTVAQRTREIGIRLALGATSQGVVRLIVVRGLVPALAGLVLGAIIAQATNRILRGLVFGVESSDPIVFAVVMAGLLAVAVVAAYLPARRATRINPVETLRAE